MENKYEVFINLDDITKDVYKKHFSEEKYDIILDEENILFVKKENKEDINLEHEKIILKVIESMLKVYRRNVNGVLHIDFTNDVMQIMKKIEGDKNVKPYDNRITWQIRQAITKGIISKE